MVWRLLVIKAIKNNFNSKIYENSYSYQKIDESQFWQVHSEGNRVAQLENNTPGLEKLRKNTIFIADFINKSIFWPQIGLERHLMTDRDTYPILPYVGRPWSVLCSVFNLGAPNKEEIDRWVMRGCSLSFLFPKGKKEEERKKDHAATLMMRSDGTLIRRENRSIDPISVSTLQELRYWK